MELKGSNAIEMWRTLLGPTDSATARNKAPISVRAKFGTGRFIVSSTISYSPNVLSSQNKIIDFRIYGSVKIVSRVKV